MPPDAAAPSSENLSSSALQHILSIYPTVLEAFYRDKIKGDSKKRQDALQDDAWRYTDLCDEVKARELGKGISKEELERLVKWKITHQTNRPFLLPQIRKNDPESVEKCTAEARKILTPATPLSNADTLTRLPQAQIRKALDKVCELKGVGPATGTLILSVYDGQRVPFFEDELYAWLLPHANEKLKYNVKEYFELLGRFEGLSSKRSRWSGTFDALAQAYEKAAFVCIHWNLVADAEKKKIGLLIEDAKEEGNHATTETAAQKSSSGHAKTLEQSGKVGSQSKRKSTASEHDVSRRRSERTKKQKV